MTYEERAKVLASQLWHSEACEPSQLIQPLAAALREVERETWKDIDNRFGISGHRIEYMRSSGWEAEFRELADYVHAKAQAAQP